jgi:hypothetical protein
MGGSLVGVGLRRDADGKEGGMPSSAVSRGDTRLWEQAKRDLALGHLLFSFSRGSAGFGTNL